MSMAIRNLVTIVSCFAALSASPVSAMNWCGLPQIIPRLESDFERLAPAVETITGCAREPSDSAHRAKWSCPDDPVTVNVFEGVHILFIREPSKGIHMIVVANGLDNLDMLRRCGLTDIRNDNRFAAGNVSFRDRLTFGISGSRLTLTSIIPEGIALITSDTKSYGDDNNVEAILQGFHGVTVESSPSTSVKLAGLSPISNDAQSIVDAFVSRGAQITNSESLDELFPEWTLSPPVGLAGVNKVTVAGFVKHVLRVEYMLTDTADYERYIGLLDTEYEQSSRTSEGGCTYRWWESGRVSIRGEHCPEKSNILTFYNDVAGDQLSQYAKKLEADKKQEETSPDKPAIDEDMF